MPLDTILRLKKTVLFQTLLEREEEEHQLSELVKKIVAHAAPLLERVPDNMPEYTLHDPNHGAKVVEIMSLIIPDKVFSNLNVIEITLLILSGYLHDIGMTCSKDEKESIITANLEYKALLEKDNELYGQYLVSVNDNNHRLSTLIEDKVFTNYLRINHVKRSKEIITNYYSNDDLKVMWNGISFINWLTNICDSHELPVSHLIDDRKWPRNALVRNLRVNVQYLALVLRLADILDLDPERTPTSILDFNVLKDPQSITEWNKHRSIIGWEITPERIQFEATCSDPTSERAIRTFLDWIEIERRDSLALTLKYRDEISRNYWFDLTEPVTKDRIISNGEYIYSDMKFNINYRRVMDLLMGENLYRNQSVALRELLQNSIDAIKYRIELEKKCNEPYSPLITVSLNQDILCVEDNGIGMDEYVFGNYFMNVGSSYYSSTEFLRENICNHTVSEFGIGILSIFMVTDSFQVESRLRPSNPLQPPAPIDFEIPTAYDYFVQRESNRTEIGTKITMKLKKRHPFKEKSFATLITELMPFNDISILVNVNGDSTIISEHHAKVEDRFEDQMMLNIPLYTELNNPYSKKLGELAILSREDRHFAKESIGLIAQRGFKIGLPRDNISGDLAKYSPEINILPSWVNCAPFINLDGENSLSLTPDRSNVIEDIKLKHVRRLIDKTLVNGMKNYLYTKRNELSETDYYNFFNNLLNSGAIIGEAHLGYILSNEATDLLSNYMMLRTYTKNESVNIRSLGELKKYKYIITLEDCAYSTNIFSQEFLNGINQYLSDNAIVVFNEKTGDYGRSNILTHIYGGSIGEFITPFSGISGSILTSEHIEKSDYYRKYYINGKMGFADTVLGCQRSNEIFMFHCSRYNFVNAIHYGLNHKVFSETLIPCEANTDKMNKSMLIELHDLIVKIIENAIVEISKTITCPEWLRNNTRQGDSSLLLINIFNNEPSLLYSLNSAVDEFWNKCFDANVVSSDTKRPILTYDDFPWYWSTDDKVYNIHG